MKHYRMLACAGAVLLVASAAAAGQAKPAAKPAPTAAPPAAPPPAAAPAKFVSPIRGEAELGFLKPVSKRLGKEIVTTIKVKNMSATNSIVGLKVDEYWYDKGGNPVTGDTFRYRKPLLPLEVIEVSLHTPINPKMDRNQYKFEHANGGIKTKPLPKL